MVAVKFAVSVLFLFTFYQLRAATLTCSQTIPPDLCRPLAPTKCLFYPVLKLNQATLLEEMQLGVKGHLEYEGSPTVPG